MNPEPEQPESQRSGLLQQVYLATEEGIYGLILVAGLVAVAGTSGQGPLQTLLFVMITVLVFWLAHVYAGTVATHGETGHAEASLRTAVKQSMRRSRGLLTATIPPAIPLICSAFGLFDTITADWIALWIIVAVLAVLGYLAYLRKGQPLHMRLLGAVSTAAFGIIIILAKALLHH